VLAAAAQPGLLAAEVALVDLHRAGEALASGTHEHRPQPSEHRPRCLEEPISSSRLSDSAEIPSFWEANSQHAVNHTVSGVRVRSKIVPAVTDVRAAQPAHSNRPSASRQPSACPHAGHTNPSGQRSHSR